MAKTLNTRAIAAKISWQIIDQGKSLDAAMDNYFDAHEATNQDRGFVQELVYGVCRWYGALEQSLNTVLRSPIRKKDRIIHFVLLVGLYQLRHLQTADHAAVGETVNACKQLDKPWAKNLVNGCLRNYQRSTNSTDEMTQSYQSHPDWLIDEIKAAWPNQCAQIMLENNRRPPMCLRVNRRINTVAQYQQKLVSNEIPSHIDPHCQDGIILGQPVPVNALPDFFFRCCLCSR